MRKATFNLLVAVAMLGGVTAGAAISEYAIARAPAAVERAQKGAGYYSLVREYEDGSQWAAEDNLGIGECFDRMSDLQDILPESTWACHLQPQGYIPSA